LYEVEGSVCAATDDALSVTNLNDFNGHHQTTNLGGRSLNLFRRASCQPADLPIEQPSKFTFNINLKVAKALGLSVPSSLVTLADKVIE